jgi:hypothetical protein
MIGVLLDGLVLALAYGLTVGLALTLLFAASATAPRMMAGNFEPRPILLLCNALIWTLSAAAGGALIAYLAQWFPLLAAFLFGCILFALILITATEVIGKTSFNYEVAVAACSLLGAVLGCLLLQYLHLHIRFDF